MPGTLLPPRSHRQPAQMDRASASRPDLYLIVCYTSLNLLNRKLTLIKKADQDTVYEQDLLRDAGSIKPWLAYIEFKQQHGTLYEQTFVCCLLHQLYCPEQLLIYF